MVSTAFHVVADVLWREDEVSCLSLIRALGGAVTRPIELLEGTLSVGEALAYARVLWEIGQADRAMELMREVWRVAFDRPRVAFLTEPAIA